MDMNYSLDTADLTLHTTIGSRDLGVDDVNDYALVTEALSADSFLTYAPAGGRSSNHAWPFFGIIGDQCGILVALGWTGQWEAGFRKTGSSVNMYARLQTFASYLNPGEEVRTPLVSITYFDGNAEYGHNLFRRVVLAHYTPDDGTENVCLLPIFTSTESYGEEKIIEDLNEWNGKLSLDAIWTDAAWFGNVDDTHPWSVQTGNWWVNTKRYPSGSLKKVSDALHGAGKKYIVWFELERIASGTELFTQHMDLLFPKAYAGSYILNLASDDGKEYMLNYLRSLISENNIDVYRQDFNSEGLLTVWQAYDKPSRAGMTENRYVTAMYEIYDALLAEFPGLMIDNCASGGKRIDLEMMKRSVILHRIDYTCNTYGFGWDFEGVQYQNQNLSYWIPLHGASVGWPLTIFSDAYYARSLLSAGVSYGVMLGYAADDGQAQKLTAEASDCRKYFYGDYYSLYQPSYDKTSRQTFMYVREDLDEAMVLIYSRSENTEITSFTVALKGLNPDTVYLVTDSDAKKPATQQKTGRELMENGVSVSCFAGAAKVLLLTPVKAWAVKLWESKAFDGKRIMYVSIFRTSVWGAHGKISYNSQRENAYAV